ncbi:hypothetical protein BIY29_14605 [Brenneria alni]|uniref:Uncharacterized protein n=1 Tax=Brenneria alni TaxID=71656 RepID=A0A421DL61_9GAMM|nr:hypothetical protein BIY29_14605 [Brenneria alni]
MASDNLLGAYLHRESAPTESADSRAYSPVDMWVTANFLLNPLICMTRPNTCPQHNKIGQDPD